MNDGVRGAAVDFQLRMGPIVQDEETAIAAQ
jgi:hypothetical protein